MTGRLVMAILSTALEESALVVVVLVGLPELGIEVPLWLLIIAMTAWATLAVFIYRMGSRALKLRPLLGPTSMVGGKGTVVSPLEPQGLIKIMGELWVAKSSGEKIEEGDEVTVVGQDRTRLTVRRSSTSGPPPV